ncbi:MAG: DEAD/DEAH box helicase, partial [Rhodococcus sp.]|nr:DEAD/DEAH box helicase [Rhodococcus sp. (in: high G+C Gram-positive bacteria)]
IVVGRHRGLAVVLEPDRDEADPRPLVLTEEKWSGRVSVGDFPDPARVLGSMRLSRHVDVRTGRGRRDLASALRSTGITAPRRRPKKAGPASKNPDIARLRKEIQAHPCHDMPEREQLSRIAERYHRLSHESQTMREKAAATTNSLARTFDRIIALLTEREYVTAGKDPQVTDAGARLARIYSESDLLVAECLRRGVWEGLGPAELAAVVSTVVYESRKEGEGPVPFGTGLMRHALDETIHLWRELKTDEIRHKLPPTREPDGGFAAAIFQWASDGSLLEALLAADDSSGRGLSAGDFVRWCRQVIDLLEQVRGAAGTPELAESARQAVKAIRRGVVALDAA